MKGKKRMCRIPKKKKNVAIIRVLNHLDEAHVNRVETMHLYVC